jgi:hypothetical protein
VLGAVTEMTSDVEGNGLPGKRCPDPATRRTGYDADKGRLVLLAGRWLEMADREHRPALMGA